MILDQHGNELTPDELSPQRDVCDRCGKLDSRQLTSGFGGFWKIHCRCGHVILSGRGEAPREGAY